MAKSPFSNHFPLTLALSPIGGEGKRCDRFVLLVIIQTRRSYLPPLHPLRGKRVGVRGARFAMSALMHPLFSEI